MAGSRSSNADREGESFPPVLTTSSLESGRTLAQRGLDASGLIRIVT